MTTLIISEKPNAAQRIASALSDGPMEKERRGKAVWFQIKIDGKRVLVVPAVGHLYNLKQKGEGWNYPVFETEWLPSYEVSKASAFSKAYLYNFKKLSGEADDFVVATDYDSEGSVIGYNILRFVCKTEKAKRMKFSTRSRTFFLSQTPLSSVSMSTTPGSSSARRFHSWKCSHLLVIDPILASTPLPNITIALWWNRCGMVSL